jgi:VWFA-related protein
MGRIVAGVPAIAVLLAAPLLAASRAITVQQLSEMVASARASRRSDNDIARDIGRVELKERLTEAALANLSADQGERTRFALRLLADESAFLDPPASELPSQGPPDLAEQKTILARAGEYAVAYMRNLPDFVCSQTIHRFDDDPSAVHRKTDSAGRLHEHDTIVSELTFNGGRESHNIRSVNGQPGFSAQSRQGLTTSGEFGAIIGSLFSGSAAQASWRRWEVIDGKRVAVFNYSVDRGHSNFVISWCCLYESGVGWRGERSAYRGELFVEPATGAIIRVTRQAADISAGFPTRRSDTVVEYRTISIGGRTWLCPARSVTISDIVKAEHPTDIGFRIHAVNESQFTDYHKFGSESTLVAAGIPATGQPDVSVPPRVSIEPPPELTATYQPASVSPLFGMPESLPLPPPAPRAPEALVDTQAIFRVRTNVVTVRVVVRDRNGHPVGDLGKDEFELRDNGQLQTISSFSVERPAAADDRTVLAGHATNPGSEQAAVHEAVAIPERYVIYVLDDLNLAFGDLSQTRAAAGRVLQDAPNYASRVAVLTTSGRIALDFTSHLTEVDGALNRITPQGRANVKGRCPPLTDYLAYRVVLDAENPNSDALKLATAEALACGLVTNPRRGAQAAAERAVRECDAQTRAVLAALKAAVRRISIMPGSRTLVLVSPGFITPDLEPQVNDVIDRAVRAGVVINTLDARGVWVLPGFDVESVGSGSPEMNRIKRQFDEQEQQLQTDVLIHLAEGTGGEVSRDNDFVGAFRRLNAAPEVSYVLGFTPTKLKTDGSFHKLKVTVADRKGLTVQARNGYFAPKHDVDAAEQAKEEIENAVFSRDEIQDIPVTLKTQVSQGKLSAIAHFGIGGIRFVNKDGHNRSSVTATVSLFEAGGKYLKGVQDVVNLDFPDDKLAAAIASGDAVRADFDAPAGSYVVRLVLRDNDGHMSSTSSPIEVP